MIVTSENKLTSRPKGSMWMIRQKKRQQLTCEPYIFSLVTDKRKKNFRSN